jgi:hypothetical protein
LEKDELQNNHGKIQTEIDKLKSQLRAIEKKLEEFAGQKKILLEEIGKMANQ